MEPTNLLCDLMASELLDAHNYTVVMLTERYWA